MRLSQMNAYTVPNQKNGLNKDLLAFLKPSDSQGKMNFEDKAKLLPKRKKANLKPDQQQHHGNRQSNSSKIGMDVNGSDGDNYVLNDYEDSILTKKKQILTVDGDLADTSNFQNSFVLGENSIQTAFAGQNEPNNSTAAALSQILYSLQEKSITDQDKNLNNQPDKIDQ